MGNVRYRWFNFNQLVRAMKENDPKINRSLLNEAVFARLESHHTLEYLPSPNKLLQPRPSYGITIKYSETLQHPNLILPGIIDWISTNGQRRKR